MVEFSIHGWAIEAGQMSDSTYPPPTPLKLKAQIMVPYAWVRILAVLFTD